MSDPADPDGVLVLRWEVRVTCLWVISSFVCQVRVLHVVQCSAGSRQPTRTIEYSCSKVGSYRVCDGLQWGICCYSQEEVHM